MMTWQELRDAPIGTKLVFPDSYDIYPYCIVPVGAKAVLTERDEECIYLLTDSAEVTEALAEWDGCVQFNPMNDGYEWTDESPVALADSKTENDNA